MTVLGRHDIIQAQRNGDIVIEPFAEDTVSTNSYDRRIGPYYWHQGYAPERCFSCVKKLLKTGMLPDPRSPANIEMKTIDLHNIDEDEQFHMWRNLVDAKKTDNIITIYPHETILCHTAEIMGGRCGVVPMISGRSTFARYGMSVENAGIGDVGYINHWTLEVTNHSENIVGIHAGDRVCQAVFYQVENHGEAYQGSYVQREGKAWVPTDMLPKGLGDKKTN